MREKLLGQFNEHVFLTKKRTVEREPNVRSKDRVRREEAGRKFPEENSLRRKRERDERRREERREDETSDSGTQTKTEKRNSIQVKKTMMWRREWKRTLPWHFLYSSCLCSCLFLSLFSRNGKRELGKSMTRGRIEHHIDISCGLYFLSCLFSFWQQKRKPYKRKERSLERREWEETE